MLLFQATSLLAHLCFMVRAFPFMEEEGSASFAQNMLHGRSFPVSNVHQGAFVDLPLFRQNRRKISQNFILHSDPRENMEEEALRRKLMWESAIRREKMRSHPDQVLPIGQDALKRSRCHALPFIQNVFRKNCFPVRLPNKFCFGQCNSFYVPGWPAGLSQPCTSCAPSRSRRISLPLRCRAGHLAWHEVELVEECECETRYDRNTVEPAGSGEGFLPVS